jgi:hypothetical protein
VVRVLCGQGLRDPGGYLIHQVIRLPGVQQARETAHLAAPRLLALLFNLLEPVIPHPRLPVRGGAGSCDDDVVAPILAAALRSREERKEGKEGGKEGVGVKNEGEW